MQIHVKVVLHLVQFYKVKLLKILIFQILLENLRCALVHFNVLMLLTSVFNFEGACSRLWSNFIFSIFYCFCNAYLINQNLTVGRRVISKKQSSQLFVLWTRFVPWWCFILVQYTDESSFLNSWPNKKVYFKTVVIFFYRVKIVKLTMLYLPVCQDVSKFLLVS